MRPLLVRAARRAPPLCRHECRQAALASKAVANSNDTVAGGPASRSDAAATRTRRRSFTAGDLSDYVGRVLGPDAASVDVDRVLAAAGASAPAAAIDSTMLRRVREAALASAARHAGSFRHRLALAAHLRVGCAAVPRRLAARVTGEIDPANLEQLYFHVERCPRCARLSLLLGEAESLLPAGPPPRGPHPAPRVVAPPTAKPPAAETARPSAAPVAERAAAPTARTPPTAPPGPSAAIARAPPAASIAQAAPGPAAAATTTATPPSPTTPRAGTRTPRAAAPAGPPSRRRAVPVQRIDAARRGRRIGLGLRAAGAVAVFLVLAAAAAAAAGVLGGGAAPPGSPRSRGPISPIASPPALAGLSSGSATLLEPSTPTAFSPAASSRSAAARPLRTHATADRAATPSPKSAPKVVPTTGPPVVVPSSGTTSP
jgi:hypothetical protein